MALTANELAAAQAIINGWEWQVAEGHNYRWAKATKTLIRFHESAPMESDEFRIVLEYLRTQTGVQSIVLNHKNITLDGNWEAKDAWYQTATDKFEGTDSNRVRIYQSLIGKDESADADGPYTVENGCQYRVDHTFYWDVKTIPSVPAGSSGISYVMQGVTRDRETGYFSCVIEKRTRVEQTVSLYDQQITAFDKQQEEQHLGVMASRVSSTGKKAGVRKGVKVTRTITKNADCTSDIRNLVITDKPVKNTVVTVRKTLRGTVVSRTDRNQASALAENGLVVGEERRSEMTDSQLFNNTVTKTTADPAGKIHESCDKRTTQHTHGTLKNVAADPGSPEVSSGTNVVRKKSVRKTDEGTYDVDETVETHFRASASTSGGTVSRVEKSDVSVNNPSVPSASPAVNVQVDVSASPNDHGSFSTTKRITTFKPSSATSGSGTTSRSEVTTVGINQVSVPVDYPSVNKQVEVSLSLNEHGSASTTKRVTTFRPESKTCTGGTAARVETTTVGINQTKVPSDAGGVNRQVDVSVSLNDHGSATTSKRVTDFKPIAKVASGNYATEKSVTTVTINDTSSPESTMGEASVSPNDHGSATTSVTVRTPIPVDSGWITWNSTSTTPNRVYRYKHGLRVFANITSVPTPPMGTDCSVSVNINKFGRYDGHVVYSELIGWVERGSGGSEGGSSSGTSTLYEHKQDSTGRRYEREITLSTITFYGSGNDGSEASYRANQKLYPGAHLGSRTYVTGISKGNWAPD